MSKKLSIWSVLPAVLSLILALGTMTVFHACAKKDDGTWMHCHAAQNDVAIVGIVLVVIFLAAALMQSAGLAKILGIVGIVGAVIAMLIPGTLVRMCMMNTMRCYTVMQPFVRVMSVLIIISAIVSIVRGR